MKPSPGTRRVLLPAAVFLAVNAAATLLDLWPSLWWLLAAANFIIVVAAAEAVSAFVPGRHALLYRRSLALIFPLLLILGWELLVGAEILNPDWFPPPSRIAAGLWEMLTRYDEFTRSSLFGRPWLLPRAILGRGSESPGELLAESHLYATLFRVILGFFIGSVPGVILGMVMGISRTVRTMIDATLSAFYVLPKIAIFPIMMLVFPDPFGEGPKVAVVAVSVFFLVAINTMVGVRDIEGVYLEAGHNYGARGWKLFRHVIFPGALPMIFGGLRLALGTALIVIIAVEFVRAKTGVGFLTFYYWEILAPEKMYAGLVVVMALGVLLTAALKWVERLVMPWRREARRSNGKNPVVTD